MRIRVSVRVSATVMWQEPSLLTTYDSLLTTHYSPLTTHDSLTVMWQEPSLASSSLKRELLIRASVPTRMLPLCEGERKPKI